MAPAVRAGWGIAGFLSGILILGNNSWFAALLAALFAFFIVPDKFIYIIAGFVLGFFYCSIYFAVVKTIDNYPHISESYLVVVRSEGKRSGQDLIFKTELQAPYRGTINVLTDRPLSYGDIVSLEGKIRPGSIKERSWVYYPKINIVGGGAGNFLAARLQKIKIKFFEPLEGGLPEKESAFLSGLLFGDTSSFSPEFREEMKRSGTTHLVALSGYNIALVALAISWIFGRFLPVGQMFLASLVSITAFVLMTGAEPSVLRAAIMGIMLLFARVLGRAYSFGHAVLWTAFAISLAAPDLVFSLGFQLSFISLLGISFLPQAIKNKFKLKEPEGDTWSLRNDALTAGSAYAVSLPLIVSLGGISFTAIPANMVILPLVPATMLLGFASGAISLFPFFGFVFLKLLDALLFLELDLLKFFSILPTLKIGELHAWIIFVYYAIIVYFIKSNLNVHQEI